MNINDNIRAEMSRKHISQGRMAKHLGISQPTFSRWLQGSLTLHQIEVIARILKVQPTDLLKGWGGIK